jgi:hypothetical protein
MDAAAWFGIVLALVAAVAVHRDAARRYGHPGFWALGTFFLLIIVFPAYLVYRLTHAPRVATGRESLVAVEAPPSN